MIVLAGLAVAAAVILAVLLFLAAPFLLIAGGVWLVARCVGGCRPAPAGPAVALARDPARDFGWAVGLLVTGALWILGTRHLAALLVGLGAGLLARRIAESRR